MRQIGVAVIGTGWCGGIRAETLASHALVKSLHLAETRAERLAELKAKLKPATATADYRELLKNREIEAVYISATPESTHYPMTRDALAAGKHVFLEKPIAMTLGEADELIKMARDKQLKFTIGYSQHFNPKFAYVRKCIRDATIGKPVTALVSRHITRMLGTKISGRSKLSPAAMESTHDLDFVFWCLEPAKPVRVYSQQNYGAMREMSGGDVPDQQWLMVTMDNGMSVVVGGGWSLPLGYPNFSTTWIEMIGTEGAVMVLPEHLGKQRRAVITVCLPVQTHSFLLHLLPVPTVGASASKPVDQALIALLALPVQKPIHLTLTQAEDLRRLHDGHITMPYTADHLQVLTLSGTHGHDHRYRGTIHSG